MHAIERAIIAKYFVYRDYQNLIDIIIIVFCIIMSNSSIRNSCIIAILAIPDGMRYFYLTYNAAHAFINCGVHSAIYEWLHCTSIVSLIPGMLDEYIICFEMACKWQHDLAMAFMTKRAYYYVDRHEHENVIQQSKFKRFSVG